MSYVPTLYNLNDPYADMYAARTSDFARAGFAAGLRPATMDRRKVALIVVDMQWDFVHPTGNLYVPGSQADLERLVNFIYRNVGEITSVYASLDTHNSFQIFYQSWWKYQDTGEQPDPFTIISLNPKGEAVGVDGRQILPVIDPVWSLGYLSKLKEHSNKPLMIWPYHCMQGTMGHNLMSALSEALAFYSSARLCQIQYLVKGTVPQVEHYGIFAPEVLYAKNPNGGVNTAILDAIARHDLIYVAGEAKSHCVFATMAQLVEYFKNQPDVLERIRFLMDCTSSVQHPAVDFDAIANAELAKMVKLGVQLVKSTDSIS